jgi:hypothetical protein
MRPSEQLIGVEPNVAAEAHVRDAVAPRLLEHPRVRHAEKFAGGLRVD